jgi:hypothetical protein
MGCRGLVDMMMNKAQEDENSGISPPYEKEQFARHSYTLQSALDMLVRRLCRQFISANWRSTSRLIFCEYIPDEKSDWFVWRTEKGDLRLNIS